MTTSTRPPELPPRKKRKSGPSGASGAHTSPRRSLHGTEEQWSAWDAKAGRAGLSWAVWTRRLQDGASARQPRANPVSVPFTSRRMLSATAEQWALWDALARAAGLSWSDWIRRVMDAA